ncbi:MAG: Ig-like domain-containing protein [Gemmatimonadaceae bacterium]
MFRLTCQHASIRASDIRSARRSVHASIPASVRASLLACFVFTAVACGGGGDGGTSTEPGPVAAVALSNNAFTFVAIGASQAVSASVNDAQGRSVISASLNWTSDNTTIADVTSSGRTATIVAKKIGTTTIRASSNGISSSIDITVLGVKSVGISPTSAQLRVGALQTFTADVTVDAGVSRSVTWTSSNPNVATINTQGILTTLSPGLATVTAVAVADAGMNASAQITVLPSRGVILSPASASMAISTTQQFTPTVIVESNEVSTVTWSSSTPSVATVNQAGLVTSVAFGATTITATSVADATLKGTAAVNVVPVVRSIAVAAPPNPIFLGQTQQLNATVTADAGLATTANWSSSNSTVAAVSTSGVVTGVSVGTATITAAATADPTKTAAVTVNIASRPISITIAPTTLALIAGTNSTLVATVNADPGINKAVTWSSSSNAIATVSSSGVVTGVTNGNATVTATSVADPTRNATVGVSVGARLASNWTASGLNGVMIENIVSTYAISTSNVYTVNSRGDVFHFDGAFWSRVVLGSAFGTTFMAVHGFNATSVFAVGTGGKIVMFNGTSWQAMTSNTTNDLNAVWVESATSAFAVGNNGAAVRLTGTSWASTPTSSTQRLTGIWAAGGNVWFAVGGNGETLRFSSGTWTRTASPSALNLRGVFGTASNSVYAVGELGVILKWDGGLWSIVNNPYGSDLYSITGATLGGTKIYIGGDRIALQIVNGNVDVIPVDVPYSVQFLSATVDANGVLWMGGERGLVLRNSGSSWDTMNLAPDLIDVWTTSLTNAWAVGEFGFIFRFTGTSWTRQTSPTITRLNTVWGASSTDAFAGGDGGLLLHWNGTVWASQSSPTAGDILSVWGTNGQNVYASTYNGEVLHYDGSAWSVATTQVNPLYAVYGSGANDVYAAGDLGTVLKFNGTSWSPINTGSAALLAGIWSSSPTNVFSVGVLGSSAASFRYATSWQSVNVGVQSELTSIWGPSPSDLYVSGASGTILRYDGTNWQNMPTGTTEYLWALTGDPNGLGGGFAVGFNSTLVTGSGPAANNSLRIGNSSRGSWSLEPSSEALLTRGTVRALPTGAARRSVKLSHAPKLREAGAAARR